MKQYRIICDDSTDDQDAYQVGDVYDRVDHLVMDSHSLVSGHDTTHGHMIQVREVSDWVAYSQEDPARRYHEGVSKLIEMS